MYAFYEAWKSKDEKGLGKEEWERKNVEREFNGNT